MLVTDLWQMPANSQTVQSPLSSAIEAVAFSADHFGLGQPEGLTVQESYGGANNAMLLTDGGISLGSDSCQIGLPPSCRWLITTGMGFDHIRT